MDRRWLDPSEAWADPTGRFLVWCLRGRFDARALEQAQVLHASGQVDWSALQRAGPQRALLPLLYDVLRLQPWIPTEALRELRSAYQAHAVRNTLLLHDLERVVELLESAGIACLLLKGAALAVGTYANPALRPMTDLDLLVQRESLVAAISRLAADGYKQETVFDAQPGMTLAFENHTVLLKQGPPKLMLELHWALFDSPSRQSRMSNDWFWETATPVSLGRMPSLTLGAEAQVLYLCAHLALHHAGEGLLWLQDLSEVLHDCQARLQWDLVFAKAEETDLVVPLQQLLPVVAEYLDAPVSPVVLAALRHLQPSNREQSYLRHLAGPRKPVARRFWADLSGMPGWGARLRYGLGNLFPTGEYMVRRYRIRHPLLTPLYYPYRWWRGLHGALPGQARR